MKIDIDSEYYHAQEKECDIEIVKSLKDGKKFATFDYAICHTHNEKICRCGWKFGDHYGTESKKLTFGKKQKKVFCEYEL